MARGVLVGGTPASLRPVFAALAHLQPVRWIDAGLVCLPDPSLPSPPWAIDLLGTLHIEPVAVSLERWPQNSAGWGAGWYIRSEHHAPAPSGVREIVQADGYGFGVFLHTTTLMCLSALEHLPAGPAVDVGCGAGILSQAWARLTGQRVLAIDLDPAAVDQTRRSSELAGCAGRVTTGLRGAHTLTESELAGHVVLANVPSPVHAVLAGRLPTSVSRVVASGIRPWERVLVSGAYRAVGLRCVRVAVRERFACLTFVGRP